MEFLSSKMSYKTIMTKKDYLKFAKQIKKDGICSVGLEDLREMDSHVKFKTLTNLRNKLKKENVPKLYAEFIISEAYFDFGCAEVDEFLRKADVYPDYMV